MVYNENLTEWLSGIVNFTDQNVQGVKDTGINPDVLFKLFLA